MIKKFILWAVRRSRLRGGWYTVVTFGGSPLFRRFEFLWPDEYQGQNTLPWWKPFNAFVHWWRPVPEQREAMHDHPRWTITIVLRGCLIERTPWKLRVLWPGSVVVRSRKYIHGFEIPEQYRGKTWTLFIVGRRKHPQNTYEITPRGKL